MSDRFLYDRAELAALARMWRALVIADRARSAVIYDERDPARAIAFGISMAIAKARYDAIASGSKFFVGRSLLRQWISGDDPFLDESSFAAANAGDGLYLVISHTGIDSALNAQLSAAVLPMLSREFLAQNAGANVAAVISESFHVSREYARDMGREIVPYEARCEAALRELVPERSPMISLVTRDHALGHRGNLTMDQMFFRFTPPRSGLRAEERRLLRYALEGSSDAEIAAFLGLAPRTIKKRWARIYAVMEPVTGVVAGGAEGRRGTEARRYVLRYVREHPEELHAYAHPLAVSV